MHDLLSASTTDGFRSGCGARLDACRARLAEITACGGPRTPANTLVPLNDLYALLSDLVHAVGLVRNVHPDTAIRQVAEECEQEVSRFATELALNRGVYDAVRASSLGGLDRTGRRLRARLIRDFRRAGVDRDEETRAEIQRLRQELVESCQNFSRNILSDVREIRLGGVELLAGLPEDYLRAHPPEADGRITITTDYPDYNPFMLYASSGEHRSELYRAFRQRAYPDNVPVLRTILEQRHRLAQLLGYPNWADYVTEDKMIRNSAAVAEFIDRVSQAAADRSRAEYQRLLERKRRDTPEADEVLDWERAYYEELVRKEAFDVDSRELRPYFEYRSVRDGLLAVVSELFGVRFVANERSRRWHTDVDVLDVIEDGRQVGRVYLDMHPREGKFKHAAMFPLVSGLRGRCLPEAALVCNFPKPRDVNGPALLEHDDVVTLFHEFGHLLHHLFSRDHEWVEFSGTGAEWDFVEVPSQLFEEWAWEPGVLRRFARHYETGREIPADLLRRLRRARHFGLGLHARQQMFYASLSLKYHRDDPSTFDITEELRVLHNHYSRFRFVEDTHFHASFGHLDTYSAVYYTYMWSLVIEKDIFGAFREGGLMSPEVAARYRRAILEPGGTKDAADLVEDFLGRPYGFSAFEEWLGAEE